MTNNYNRSHSIGEQNKPIDIKALFRKLVRRWYWFAFSTFFLIVLAWFINHFLEPNYKMEASLIVERTQEGLSSASIFKELEPGREPEKSEKNINPVATLMSYRLNLETIESLNWQVSWYEKTLLYNSDLYPYEPYKVTFTDPTANTKGLPIRIVRRSAQEFTVDVDAVLEVGSVKRKIAFKQDGKFGQPFVNNYFSFTLTENDIKSLPPEGVLLEFNDYQDFILSYQKNLKITTDDLQPGLVNLQLKTSNAQRGVDYLNRLQETFILRSLKEKNRIAENKLRFIDSQLTGAIDSLSTSENSFTKFRTQNKVVDINQENGLALQRNIQLENELSAAQLRVDYFKTLKQAISDPKQMSQVVSPASLGINDLTLNSLVIKLGDLYSRREVMSMSVREKAPSFQVLLKEIEVTQGNLNEVANNLLSAANIELNNLKQRLGGLNTRLYSMPQTEQQLSNLKRKYEMNSELYNYLIKLRTESAINYASNLPDAKILDPARMETTKLVSPRKAINYIIALIIGLLVPFAWIKTIDYLNDTLQTKEEVEQLIGAPIAGVVNRHKYTNDLAVIEHPRSSIAESFRLIRTNLKYLLTNEEDKVIAVQSALAGDGKSFTALNLSLILSVNNYKVLLVAADMRIPKLQQVLGTDNPEGLSSYLSNQYNFNQVVSATKHQNLSFVSSGPIPPNPAELLESTNFNRFLSEAKKQFDYVVLDTPPISMVADGLIIGKKAEANLFVVRFGHTTKHDAAFINELILKKSVPNINLVLNDATDENIPYGKNNAYHKKNKGYYVD